LQGSSGVTSNPFHNAGSQMLYLFVNVHPSYDGDYQTNTRYGLDYA